jgi:actin-related protein 5
MVQLQVVEQKLLAHDPTFTSHQTHASLATQRSALISAFRPQFEESDVEGSSVSSTVYLSLIFVGNTRVYLNTERWRVCETWFSPGMAGIDSAGLGEVVQNVLARFSDAEKGRLASVRSIFYI